MTTFNTPTLRDKATAVKLYRRMFNPSQFDRAVTTSVDATSGTNRAGKYMKRLLKNCTELQDALTAYGKVYQYVRDNTLPWMDEGMRLVPNANYSEFLLGYRDLVDHADNAVKRLYNVWDTAVMNDQTVLKGMWDPDDYPSKDEMLDRWELRLMPFPIPTSNDFRIDLDETDKALLDSKIAEVEANATVHVLKEVFAPVKAMAEKLKVAKGEKGSVFRDTLVSNMRDACERAKALNINHDERVDEVVKEIDELLGSTTPKDLREDEALRAHMGQKMSEIEATMQSWF